MNNLHIKTFFVLILILISIPRLVFSAILFNDDFESGLSWTVSDANLSGINTLTTTSTNNYLFTRGDIVTATSSTMDTISASEVHLSLVVVRGADNFLGAGVANTHSENPEPGENLQVGYINNTGGFTVLGIFTGGAQDQMLFNPTYSITAANAFHANFQIRIRQTRGDGGPPANEGKGWDYWHVDNVMVRTDEVLNLHLDGPVWTGAADDVIDFSGSANHGVTNGGISPVAGQVCSAADFSANSTTDYISVNNNALNGLINFTISFWLNTTNTGNQAAISGSNGGAANEILAWFQNNTTFQPFLKDAGLGTITIPNIADGDWHHFVWGRTVANNCVAVDGVFQGCVVGGSAVPLDISAGGLILGQEQDRVGGSFDINQDWEGEIDEVLIFSRILTSSEVQSIFNNQSVGKNWDGSARTCPDLTPRMEVGEVTLNDTLTTPAFTSVTFKQTYTVTPLVFLLPSNEGGEPSSIRIRNVTTSGFEVSQVEPENLDGGHPAMTVNYLAIEPGVHELPDGRTIEAATHDTNSIQHGAGVPGGEAWDTVNFKTTFSNPVSVLVGIQGMVNEDSNPPTTTSRPWLVPAVRNAGTSSVELALGRGEVNDGNPATVNSDETLGYVAIEGNVQGRFSSGAATVLYESIVSADNITGWGNNNCAGNVGIAVNFVNRYVQNPLVVGNISKHDGQDGGWIRRCRLTPALIGVSVDEDQFRDAERNHTDEAASFLVFSEEFCLPVACNAPPVDHYAISFPVTSAITCEALEVDIVAHADATDHTQIATPANGTVITVTANVATAADVVWQEGTGGNGSLVNGVPGAGQAQYTFDGTETSVELFMRYPNAEAGVSVNVTDGAASDTEATEDPTVEFVLAVFRFLDDADANIGTQIAGKSSSTAPGDQTLQLRAVRTNTTTLECEAALNGVAIPVEFAYQCNNPSTCAITNNGASITAGATTDIDDITVAYTSLNMNFSPAGVAEFSFIYDDVGDISLLAQKAIAADPSATPPTTAFTIQGTSAPFVVRPFGFDIQVTANPAATSAAGDKFIKAGEDFTVTARAVAWNVAGDTNNDGVPDNHADIDPSNNADLSSAITYPTTPNYGQEGVDEATDEDIDLSALLNQPSGNDPGLSGGTSITTISGGRGSSATVNYDEVGIIEITARVAADNDYLGAGAVIGKSGYVGRFVPFVFQASTNMPEFTPACGSFSYIGQAFTYTATPPMAPVISLIAKSKGTAPATFGSTTQNYTGSFFKLTDRKLVDTGNKTYTAATGTLDTILLPSPDPQITDTAKGTATLTFSAGSGIAFNRGNPMDPFDADIALSINVFDTDDVFVGNGIGASLNPVTFGTATAGNGIDFASGNKEQRWGRMVLDNTFGSELLTLKIPIRTEYQTSGNFITNTDDSCTPYDSANINFSNHNGITAGNLTATGAGTLMNGVVDNANPVILSNTRLEVGFVDVTHTLGLSLSWLLYDWDGIDNVLPLPDGDFYDDDPFSRATWGIFSGPDEFIYIREPW